MSASIIPFTYGAQDVRVVEVDGEPWFVLADIGAILGTRGRDLGRMIDAEDRGAHFVRTPSGEQEMATVNEAGLYTVLLRSNNPAAKPFRRWVTSDVLPSIRRTGQYGAPRELTGPELMARALIEADATIKAQAAELEAARPKVVVADRLLDASTDLSVQDAANALTRAGWRIGRQRLFSLLKEIGWIHRGGDGAWRPYARHIEAGRVSVLPQSHYHPRTGDLVLDPPQVRVTPKGVQELLLGHGPRQTELAVVTGEVSA